MAKSGGENLTKSWKTIKLLLAIFLVALILQDLPSAEARRGRRRCLVKVCKLCKRFHFTGRSRRSASNETMILGDGKDGFDINNGDPLEHGLDIVNDLDDTFDDEDEDPDMKSTSQNIVTQQLWRKFFQHRRLQYRKQCNAYKRWTASFQHERPLYNGTTSTKRHNHTGGKLNPNACKWLRRQAAFHKYHLKSLAELAEHESHQQQVHQKRSLSSYRSRCAQVIQTKCCRNWFMETMLIGYRYKT